MADTPILMPQLGESVTEGTIAKWLKQPGERVEKYEALAEVITDKVNAEIPSPVTGMVTEILAPEGATVAVRQEICRIDEGGVAAAQPTGTVSSAAAKAGSAAADVGTAAPDAAERPAEPAAPPASALAGTPAARQAGGRYSPAVLKLAQEHNVDLSQVVGTGLEGRVTRKDVLALVEKGGTAAQPPVPAAAPVAPAAARAAQPAERTAIAPAAPVQPPAAGPSAPQAAGDIPGLEPGDEVIQADAIRRRIAERMVQSKREAPHAWSMVEADVTGLVKLRQAHKDEFKRREGADLTFMPFVIKAVSESLREYPLVNSSWNNGTIIIKRRINISLAVAAETGLAVPVIKDADQKSISGLAHAVADLAGRARAGRLTLDDISGGTFTVDNTGSFGSILSQPIINPPQAAIITFEAIVQRPVVRDDAIAIRSMVNLCLSLDHRVLDGVVAGRFLQAVRQRLESYGPETSLY